MASIFQKRRETKHYSTNTCGIGRCNVYSPPQVWLWVRHCWTSGFKMAATVTHQLHLRWAIFRETTGNRWLCREPPPCREEEEEGETHLSLNRSSGAGASSSSPGFRTLLHLLHFSLRTVKPCIGICTFCRTISKLLPSVTPMCECKTHSHPPK